MNNNILNERLVRMGLGHWAARPGAESLPAALDLLPWWALLVRDPERDSQEICDLPSVIAATFGMDGPDNQRVGQSISILKSALPIPATLPELTRALSRKAIGEGFRTRTTSGTAEGILWMLGFLANQNDQNGLRKLFVDTAIQILVDPSSDESSRLVRVISLISVRYGFEELAAPLAALVDGQEACLSLEIPGALANLGEPGHRALLGLLSFNGSRKSPELRAAIAAYFDNDFDGLVPLLESEGWQQRASTARLLCHLARAGKQPAAVLEMLLSRARLEQDSDAIAVISNGIGVAVQKIGKPGVEAVLATLQNQFGDGSGNYLIDALLLADPKFLDPIDIENLRLNHDNTRGVSLKRRRAINRILSWQEGYPVCVADWATDSVYRLLQWEDLKLPLAVQSWFSATPTLPADELIVGLLSSGRYNENHGFAIAQVLRQRGSDHRILKAVELAGCTALSAGQSKMWTTLCGVLAGSSSPVALHPAELRAAFGVAAGTPLPPDWAAAGRLLAIASNSVKQAQGALNLIAGMGPDFREMARHALATTPPHKDKNWSLSSIPIAGRLGSQGLDSSILGGNPIHLSHPVELPPEFQLLFDKISPEWTTPTGSFIGLQVASAHQADFSYRFNDWQNTKRVEACLAETPVIIIQRAILAAVSTDDAKLNQIGLRLAHLAPESALEGALGPLILVHRQRARANGIEHQLEASPTPTDDDDEDLNFESLEDFLES